jgi:putative SOS response-associated peptidase YedK
MCGRYAASHKTDDLVEEFEIVGGADAAERADGAPGGGSAVGGGLEADYNVAPTKPVYAVLERAPRGSEDAEPVRQLRVVTWGLVPSWAKDPSIGNRMINARVETVAEKSAYRKAFAARRCLLPADGYYEWYGEQRGKKQPFFIRPRDGGILAMAGLYELWRDRSRESADPQAWLWTCVVLTTQAQDSLGRIHDRMPMFVERERYGAWLDPANEDPDTLRSLLVPATPDRLEAYAVSTEVNNVRNNGPQLLEPLPLEEINAEAVSATDAEDANDVEDAPSKTEEPKLF